MLEILISHPKFLLFGLKALQKCKNFQKILISRYRYLRLKFQYIMHLCKIHLLGKFHFIQLFYGKTMNAFKESELCIKNVFFLDTFCSSSSKNERRGGDQFLQFLLNRPHHHSFIFCAILTLCISKGHIFHKIFKLYKSIHSFAIKNWKKRNFLNRCILHRCIMY